MKKISSLIFLVAVFSITSLLTALTFSGCNRPEPDDFGYITIKGKFNTFLDPCHGCCLVIDVQNAKNLGVQNGTYHCPACQYFSVTYNNSIAIPYFYDVETEKLTYTGDGTEWLQSLHEGSQITMVCRLATREDDYRFMSATACTSNHIPASLPKYVVESIIKVN